MDWLWLLPVLFPAVGFFWGNCPCCGCGEVCASCSGDTPSQIVIEASGFSGDAIDSGSTPNNCDCDLLNGVFVVEQLPANPCRWRTVFPFGSCNVVYDFVKGSGISGNAGLTDTVTAAGRTRLYTGALTDNDCMQESILLSGSTGSICTGADASSLTGSPEC